MPQIGDLFARLGQGQTLSVGEIETLRLEMNQVQSAASRMAAIVTPSCGLDSNIFRNSSSFTQLPSECASLHQANATAQAIDNNTWTTPTFDSTSGATWSRGLGIDVANSRINVTAIPRGSVLLIFAWAGWASNTTGQRAIKWTANDGSYVGSAIQATETVAGAQGMVNSISHMRIVSGTQTTYSMQVYQGSGGSLALDGCLLAMVRVR